MFGAPELGAGYWVGVLGQSAELRVPEASGSAGRPVLVVGV